MIKVLESAKKRVGMRVTQGMEKITAFVNQVIDEDGLLDAPDLSLENSIYQFSLECLYSQHDFGFVNYLRSISNAEDGESLDSIYTFENFKPYISNYNKALEEAEEKRIKQKEDNKKEYFSYGAKISTNEKGSAESRLELEEQPEAIEQKTGGKDNTDKPQQKKSIKDYFKFKLNEDNITNYLTELKTIFKFEEKLTFGGVCLALFERNLHKKDVKAFSDFMIILAEYWEVELPKDKRKNKYKKKKDELVYQYAILNRELK